MDWVYDLVLAVFAMSGLVLGCCLLTAMILIVQLIRGKL